MFAHQNSFCFTDLVLFTVLQERCGRKLLKYFCLDFVQEFGLRGWNLLYLQANKEKKLPISFKKVCKKVRVDNYSLQPAYTTVHR
jgi:hypothetical protein